MTYIFHIYNSRVLWCKTFYNNNLLSILGFVIVYSFRDVYALSRFSLTIEYVGVLAPKTTYIFLNQQYNTI